MSSSQFPLRQSGIYRNLPSFDSSLKGLKALVVGATGISGFHTIRALLDTPERWSEVYAVSRSPLSEKSLSLLSQEQRSRIQHVAVDMTSSAKDIAQALRKAEIVADYVFYYAYMSPKSGKSAMDPETADELVEINVPPFKSFLDSLPVAGIKPKRILLQTGGKPTACTLAACEHLLSSRTLNQGTSHQISIILKKMHFEPSVTNTQRRSGTLFTHLA